MSRGNWEPDHDGPYAPALEFELCPADSEGLSATFLGSFDFLLLYCC